MPDGGCRIPDTITLNFVALDNFAGLDKILNEICEAGDVRISLMYLASGIRYPVSSISPHFKLTP